MFKKILPVILIVLLLPLAGFGCKGISAEQAAATKPVTLEFWTVYDDVDALQALIDKYKADRPYLTVNLKQLRSDEFDSRLVNALAEDQGPDIISIQNKAVPYYQTKLASMPASVKDTTVSVTKNAIGGTDTAVNINTQVLPAPLDVNREYVQAVGKDVILDGKVYGLPLSLDNLALYYNKDLLDKAGIPEVPQTWQDFQAAVKKLTKFDKATGKIIQSGAALGTGNNIPGFDDLLYVLFRQSGLSFVSTNGYTAFNIVPSSGVGANGTPAMSVMDFFTDFSNPLRDTYTWNESMGNALDEFVNGELAFYFGYSFDYPTIKARAPQLNFEILPMLQLNPEQPVNVANYWVQAVTLKSKHQNEAWSLINYLAHSKATKDYLDQADRPSALRTYIGGQMDKPELAPFASQVLISESWYKGKNYTVASQALADMLHQWLLTPPDANRINEWRQSILDRAAARVNQTL